MTDHLPMTAKQRRLIAVPADEDIHTAFDEIAKDADRLRGSFSPETLAADKTSAFMSEEEIAAWIRINKRVARLNVLFKQAVQL